MVLHFLTLRSRRTDQRAACEDEVLSLHVHVLVDQEIFLLGADRCGDMLDFAVSEKMKDLDGLIAQSVHGTKKRSLLVECLTAVGAEGCRDVERTVLDECR